MATCPQLCGIAQILLMPSIPPQTIYSGMHQTKLIIFNKNGHTKDSAVEQDRLSKVVVTDADDWLNNVTLRGTLVPSWQTSSRRGTRLSSL